MNAYDREVLECSLEEERVADRRFAAYMRRVAAANGRFLPDNVEGHVSGIDLYNEHKGSGYAAR